MTRITTRHGQLKLEGWENRARCRPPHKGADEITVRVVSRAERYHTSLYRVATIEIGASTHGEVVTMSLTEDEIDQLRKLLSAALRELKGGPEQ